MGSGARLAAAFGLAGARLRHRPLRRALVVLGVAAATVLPVAAQGSARVVAAEALRHGIEGLPAGQRSLIVSLAGVELAPADLSALGARSRAELSGLTAGAVRGELLFREIADLHGGSFHLGAADDLGSAVRVTSGRLPGSCTPARCEVLAVGQGTPDLDPALGLVVVGRGVRTDPLLLTGTFDPGHDVPLLLADGVARAQALASLQLFQRSYGWVAPLDLGQVRALGVSGYLDRNARAADALSVFRSGLLLTAPDTTLRAEDERAALSSRRFGLLAGAGTVLLLGFSVIAALGLRRDRLAFEALLRRRGASRGRVRLTGLVEAAVPVALGTLLGLVVGGAVAALAARAAGLGAGATGRASVVAALPAVVAVSLLAVLVVAVTASWPDDTRSRTAWRVVDAAVLVAIATALLAVARGTVGTAALDAGTDPLLAALPVLVVVAGGLLAARLWPWVVGAVGRVLPRRWLGARLALLGGIRRPLRPVATVAFLTAATAVVVFAGSYRATLEEGAADQAAAVVPLDARLTVGPTLERPLDVAASPELAALVPGASVHPVVRAAAAVRLSATEAVPVQLLGVDPAVFAHVSSWDHGVGGLTPAAVADRLDHPVTTSGIPVPAAAATVRLPATGDVDQVQLTAWLRLADGRDVGVDMTYAGGAFGGRVPVAGGAGEGARLTALTLAESPGYATRHQHAIGEGTNDRGVLSGRIVLGPVGQGWQGWASSADNAQAAPVSATAGSDLSVRYVFTGARVVVRAGGVPTGELPVLADPSTAARASGGLLRVNVGTGSLVAVRVVGVLPRFPTVGGSFLLADSVALADALDAREPGTGAVSEEWVAAPASSVAVLGERLASPPYDRLTVRLRATEQARLADDPLAVWASRLLVVSALLALAVAVLAVVLLVVADRRDESAELYAWESDGVPPSTLRAALFGRALAVVLVAVPAGLLVGLVLSRATTALVTVTAVGTAPTPPLALAVGPGWAAGVLGAGLVLSVAAAAVVAGLSLRERLPVPPEGGLS